MSGPSRWRSLAWVTLVANAGFVAVLIVWSLLAKDPCAGTSGLARADCAPTEAVKGAFQFLGLVAVWVLVDVVLAVVWVVSALSGGPAEDPGRAPAKVRDEFGRRIPEEPNVVARRRAGLPDDSARAQQVQEENRRFRAKRAP